MLDLQAINPITNKENLPLALDPQSKRLATQLNQVPSNTRRNMCANETLEATMDVVERGTRSLKKANKSRNIPMSFLNGKTRFGKMGLGGVLIE
jgi:hypothetical protein